MLSPAAFFISPHIHVDIPQFERTVVTIIQVKNDIIILLLCCVLFKNKKAKACSALAWNKVGLLTHHHRAWKIELRRASSRRALEEVGNFWLDHRVLSRAIISPKCLPRWPFIPIQHESLLSLTCLQTCIRLWFPPTKTILGSLSSDDGDSTRTA